ncbi:HD domain-containing phosphohydrolase [Anaerotalea alkaliphila]|uniref:Diguanylate cyclase n=1 Tax=Anaerotalea alkaliphila TaxID=2662126 RepID=A0A7X5HWT2_9FIRM|nr:HD domain-containing phosphohydrolase [Anaerotalea alkaliphila]NDL68109.1 diguanylate cyclase [Anaerotalea alkaliphila]
MTGNYALIPILALVCYGFLLFAFLGAQKTKLGNAFLSVLVTLILWTGGSLFMRSQIWPSTKLWYDVSLLGISLLPYTYYLFVNSLVEGRKGLAHYLWPVLLLGVNGVNIATGLFLEAPAMVRRNGEVLFVYHPTWRVGVYFVLCGMVLLHLVYLLGKHTKSRELGGRQFAPILLGGLLMFLGNLVVVFPYFKGFPADILAGVLNACLLFFVLYRQNTFKLRMLMSRGSYYLLAGLLSVLLFFNLFGSMEAFIRAKLPAAARYDVLIMSVIFTSITALIYLVMKRFIDSLFAKEDVIQAKNLQEFSQAVSKSLEMKEIMEELVVVIQKTLPVKRVHICVAEHGSGDFRIGHSANPLDSRSFSLKKDNPVVQWLEKNDRCLLMKDFVRTVSYKSMWEEEKRKLQNLEVECLVPLKDGQELVGIVLLPAKEKKKEYTYDDISFLSSVDSVGSIALKNSRLYEKAYLEARMDDLTGLYNRKYFYEILNEEYEKSKDRSLGLVILNLDDFKLYNQLYGTKEGDKALQAVAGIIKASVGKNGYVARYSGKEFAVILPMYDLLSAKNLAETIRKQILGMNKRDSEYLMKVLTVSGGVCSIPYAASNVRQLVDNADMAVYQVKRNGKNAIRVYSSREKEAGQPSVVEEKKKESIYSEYASTIYALTAAIDTKDHYTFSHSKNVAYYATALARSFGMNEEYVEIVREAALLHDIGKIGIPEQILNKPGKLSEEEYGLMKNHVENSIGIIRYLPSLDYVIPAVIGHHERYDGKGYPRRLAGEDIPLAARILCVADSFDAMISKRTYKQAYRVEYALRIIEEEGGRQFDPRLAELFVEMVRSGAIQAIQEGEDPKVDTHISAPVDSGDMQIFTQALRARSSTT